MNETENIIYIIDDDEVMRLSCQQILAKNNYSVETFENGLTGLARIAEKQPSLIIVDLKMPKIGGLEVIDKVHKLDPNIAIIVITGYATIDTAVDAMKAGAYDFLPKPFTPNELRLIVNRALERRHLIAESNRLRREKEKMQRQFITFVSHQLQSPLVVVQQFLDVLNHLGDTPNKEQLQKEWINRSLIKIKDLIALIRDWLKISKIDSGILIEQLKAIDLKKLLIDIHKTYQKQIKAKAITFEIDIPDTISLVNGTTECLSVLFTNLIINAIKYNKQNGRITVQIQENSEFVIVSVQDTGIGIASNDMEFIFDEFNRVKSEATQNIPGTGLGLPICQKILKELGGNIKVESTINNGSTFIVSLPKSKG